MHFPRSATLVACSILSFIVAAAQAQVTKDPTALAVLQQMTAVTGWSAATIPSDAVGTGSVTTDAATKSITIKARRGHQVRLEFPVLGTVVVVNGDQGRRTTSSGTRWLQPHSVFSLVPWAFPFFTMLVEYPGTDVSVSYLGTESVQGQTAHRIELRRTFATGDVLDPVRNRVSRIVVSVSATTYLPINIEYQSLADNNPTAVLSAACYLSDYRSVGLVLTPFHLEEFASVRRLYTLQLNSVQVNVGLSDADFTVQ